MRFSVGYQYPDEDGERFPEIIRDYQDAVAEVYFAWGDMPSARSPAVQASGYTLDEGRAILLTDLAELCRMGIHLNLLFNANCYGGACVSTALEREVLAACEALAPDSVTTSSLFIASCLRKCGTRIPIRASVNMNLGSVSELDYLSDVFDSFCVARELNWDVRQLSAIRDWAQAHDKEIVLLVNSGCLWHCPVHTFHDNLVAHLKDMRQGEQCPGFDPVFCRSFYKDARNRPGFLEHVTFIRPEDLCHYTAYADLFKLATRTHANVRLVLEAYTAGRFTGNLFDLTEPSHGMRFENQILDNRRFPDDWWQMRVNCAHTCQACGKCRALLPKLLISATDRI